MSKKVHEIQLTARERDLTEDNYFLLDGGVSYKLPANLIASVKALYAAMSRGDEVASKIKPRIFGTNWFDESSLIEGWMVRGTDGKEVANGQYCCTPFIPIDGSDLRYVVKNAVAGDQVALFDINLQFITGFECNTGNIAFDFHLAKEARFARYSVKETNIDNFFVVKRKDNHATKTAYHFRGWLENSEIIVSKDGSGDFTSLTEAAAAAIDGDIIHVKAGVYDNEAVQLFGKTVTIYGDGCLNTIIKNGWNTYSKAPIEMTTGVLRDIQVYAYDGGGESQDQSGATAYSLHVDSDKSFGKTFLVERCILKSDKGNNSVGVGIYGGCTFTFRDCQIIGGTSSPFFIHDTTNILYVGEMNLELYNNTFVSGGNGSMGIGAGKMNGSTVYITAFNNSFKDNSANSPQLFTSENPEGTASGNTNIGIVNWNVKPLNNGNNLTILNATYQMRSVKYSETFTSSTTVPNASAEQVYIQTDSFFEFIRSGLITSPVQIKVTFKYGGEDNVDTGFVLLKKQGTGHNTIIAAKEKSRAYGEDDTFSQLYGDSLEVSLYDSPSGFDGFTGFTVDYEKGSMVYGTPLQIVLKISCFKLE